MHHRLGKGVVGLIAGVASICLLALPAPADETASIEFVSSTTGTQPGNITIYNPDEEALTSIPLPTPGPPCSTGASTPTLTVTGSSSTTSGSGTIAIAFTNQCKTFTTGSGTTLVQWCRFTTGTWSGTWTHSATSANTFDSDILTPGFTVTLRRNTGTTHSCHSVANNFCTMSFGDLPISGTINSPGMELASSATVTFSGQTPAVGDLLVTGSATDCGIFIAANNGSLSVNAHVHVESNP
jgi:hypothetical protein